MGVPRPSLRGVSSPKRKKPPPLCAVKGAFLALREILERIVLWTLLSEISGKKAQKKASEWLKSYLLVSVSLPQFLSEVKKNRVFVFGVSGSKYMKPS